jgi:hypothetical protein
MTDMAVPQGPLRVEYDIDTIVSDNGTTLFDLIVDRAAAQLVEQLTKSRDEFYSTIRNRVNAVRNELLREKLEPVIEEALKSSVQRTNTFGGAVGDPTTLTELIIEEGRKQLQSGAGSTSSTRRQDTVLDRIIAEEVNRQLSTELKAAVEAGKSEILDRVRGEAAQIMASAISRMAQA